MAMEEAREAVGDYKEGWHDPEHSTIRFDSGLSEEVVRKISQIKNEPEWMTEIRVKAYHHFVNRPMPGFGDREALEGIDFDKVCYYQMPPRKIGTMCLKTSVIRLIVSVYQRPNRNGFLE